MMKILQLGKAYPPINLGGVEVVIQLLTEGLNKAGINCDALGVNGCDKYIEEKNDFGGTIYRAKFLTKKFSTLLSLNLISTLYKIYSKYDIIHVHHPDPMSTLALWLVNPKCKIVLHWHSDIIRQKHLLKIFRPFQNWLLKKSDIIIATSPNYVYGSYDLQPYIDKVTVVPIGIDKTKLFSDASKTLQIKQKYDGQKIVLTIGRMSYYKGYNYLIDAVKYIHANCIVLIIGDGEQEKQLKQRAAQLGLNDRIVFLGKVSNEERNCYLNASEIFVLSSIFKTEAFAIVQLEAMALGKPIVSTEIPGSGVHWVNQNNVSGLTVPIKDPKRLGEAINSIAKDDEHYRKLSQGAQERFDNNFTQDKMVEHIISIYKKIL